MSIQRKKKKASTTTKDSMFVVETEDEVEAAVMNEIGISTTTLIMEKEKTQPKDKAKVI